MENVELLTKEYQTIIGDCEPFDWETIEKRLVQKADWSSQGAETVVYLAKHYGSFVLRNALALSIALEIEDGEIGL